MKIGSGTRWFAVVVFIVSIGVAMADIAPSPRVEKKRSAVLMVIKSDSLASASRLVIPRKFIEAAMRAEEVGAAVSRPRSMMAGIALSLAITSVFLIRQRKRSFAISGAVLLVLLGSFGVYELANADVPPFEAPPAPIFERETIQATHRVVIEIAEGGDTIEFIHPSIPPKTLKKVAPGRSTRSSPPSDGAVPPR